jgi:hypothetical protein
MLDRPASKHQHTAWGMDTPEFRTAHAAGSVERFDTGWAAIDGISLE